MATSYGGYEPLTPFATASGGARWCFASKGGREFLLKEFPSPTGSVSAPLSAAELRRTHAQRNQAFEERKKRLYAALYAIHCDTLVPVIDFFRSDGRYYAVSERIPPPCLTGAQLLELPQEAATECLRQLTRCLALLRGQGIVHADLRPEHLLLTPRRDGSDLLRLIDFDKSYFEDSPPADERELAGDPVFMAPETFLCTVGRPLPVTCEADTFALGLLMHLLLTGELPRFDARYTYAYEAVLDGGVLAFSPKLPVALRPLVSAMLSELAQDRPPCEEILAALTPVEERVSPELARETAHDEWHEPMSFRHFDRSEPAPDKAEPDEALAERPAPADGPPDAPPTGRHLNGLSKYMRPLPF